MDRDGQRQFRRSGKAALRAFRLTAGMDVRSYIVDQQQEGETAEQADDRRPDIAGVHFHGGNQQRPDRGRDHDAGGKAQQRFLHPAGNLVSHEKNKG